MLELPAKITAEMQGVNVTPTDFYRMWLGTKLKLKLIKTPLAKKLITCMEKREALLLKNEIMKSCLFLDSRFQIELNEVDISEAKQVLTNLFRRSQLFEDEQLNQTNTSTLVSETSSNNASNLEDVDPLENYLQAIEKKKECIYQLKRSIMMTAMLGSKTN